jgi:transposase
MGWYRETSLPGMRKVCFKSGERKAVLKRTVLSDEQWARIAPLLPGKEGDPGRSGRDNRLFVEGVLWIVRAGAPWRDLPEQFGKWSSVWQRFRRWAKNGALIDGTIVKVHRHGTGAKGGLEIRPSASRAAA